MDIWRAFAQVGEELIFYEEFHFSLLWNNAGFKTFKHGHNRTRSDKVKVIEQSFGENHKIFQMLTICGE